MDNAREMFRLSLLEASSTYKNLLLNWATGVGKTYAAIALQEHLDSKKTLICVAEVSHIDTWKQEYIKHGKERLLETTSIICYQSLKKFTDIEVDLLINDECHHISEAQADYLSTIKAKHVLSLSATTSLSERSEVEALWGPMYTSVVTMDTAVKFGILTQPNIILLEMTLNNSIKNQIIELKKGKDAQTIVTVDYKDRHVYINKKNIILRILCTEYEKYQYLNSEFNKLKNAYLNSSDEYVKLKWLRAGLERKRYIASLKTSTIQNLVRDLEDKRYLCFCGSVAQAETISSNIIYSRLKVKDRDSILKSFMDKTINHLVAVDMLKEGVNIPDIDAVVIGQLDGKERSFIQKSGRALRNTEEPLIYVIYIKDTQDEKYLENALYKVNPEFTTTIKV